MMIIIKLLNNLIILNQHIKKNWLTFFLSANLFDTDLIKRTRNLNCSKILLFLYFLLDF